MYTISHSKNFKKALKKIERSGQHSIQEIRDVVYLIASGAKLDKKYQDHQLQGKMSGNRECHIKADLLLVYKLNKMKLIVITIDIDNHSSLFK